MTNDPYNEGWQAYFDNVEFSSNPYANTTADFDEWQSGWNDAHIEDDEELLSEDDEDEDT